VSDVDVDRGSKVVKTFVVHDGPMLCPTCRKPCSIHDHRERQWRHLDLYECEAYVVAKVPRADFPEHGVHQLPIP